MITPKTCDVCKKEKCAKYGKHHMPEELTDFQPNQCHGSHESEGEKKRCPRRCDDGNPEARDCACSGWEDRGVCRDCHSTSELQPKVCERCNNTGLVEGEGTSTHDICPDCEHAFYEKLHADVKPWPSPLPPKDGKGEGGWEKDFDKRFGKELHQVASWTYEECAKQNCCEERDFHGCTVAIKSFIRKVFAQGIKEGRSEMAAKGREAIVKTCLEIPEEISARYDVNLKDVPIFHLGANIALAAFDKTVSDLNTKGEGHDGTN